MFLGLYFLFDLIHIVTRYCWEYWGLDCLIVSLYDFIWLSISVCTFIFWFFVLVCIFANLASALDYSLLYMFLLVPCQYPDVYLSVRLQVSYSISAPSFPWQNILVLSWSVPCREQEFFEFISSCPQTHAIIITYFYWNLPLFEEDWMVELMCFSSLWISGWPRSFCNTFLASVYRP